MLSSEKSNQLELVAEGFSFPTSLTFDETGAPYVAESGLPFGGARPGGRVWRLANDGSRAAGRGATPAAERPDLP